MPDIVEQVRLYFTQTMHLGPEVAQRLLLKARDVLARDLEALEACVQGDGSEALAGRLHKLKGDLANIGLVDLAASAQALGAHAPPLPSVDLARGVSAIRAALGPLLQHG